MKRYALHIEINGEDLSSALENLLVDRRAMEYPPDTGFVLVDYVELEG